MEPAATNRLLIADDMANFRKILRTYLRSLRFEVISEAADGHSALKLINEELQAGREYHLILADINMPNGTGLDLLRWIRSEPRTAALPVILVTAEADSSQVSEAIQFSVDDYIVKPFNFDALQEKINKVFLRHYGRTP